MPAARKANRIWCQMVVAGLLLGGWMISAGVSKTVSEYQIKAVFLYNFTKFVNWPADAGSSTKTSFVIGIVGEDPFRATLENTVGEEMVQHRPIVIQRFRSEESVANCNMLFIARSEKDRVKAVLEQVKGRAILTVADTPQAAEQGVMINLSLVEGSVKMEINQTAVESAGLQISAKVLSLARIVSSTNDKTPSKP